MFDYAELCAALPTQQVIDALGWVKQQIEQYKSIKTCLCTDAWAMLRSQSTENFSIVDDGQKTTVDWKSTIVDWKESHFRAFLKELPYDRSNPDRNIMRAQVAAITELIEEARNPKRNGEGSMSTTCYGFCSGLRGITQDFSRYSLVAGNMRV